jgi:hypothetical protein
VTVLNIAPAPAAPKRAAKPQKSPKPATKPKAKAKPKHALPVAAYGVGAVAVALTGLSLVHLADGIDGITHCGLWQAGAMALGIDANFVATEATLLTTDDETRKRIVLPARITTALTLTASALLNAYSFARHADNMYTAAAGIGLGVLIPALIYLATSKLAQMRGRH